ncbi:MAG: peptidylprolyl isomerase [Holophagales bacterium]|nr:peptidylprolyl isomerase [Holophagales bacterium]
MRTLLSVPHLSTAAFVGLLWIAPAPAIHADESGKESQRSYRVRVSQQELESWMRARSGAPFLRGQSALDGLILTKSLSDEAIRLGLDRSPRTRVELLRLHGKAAMARLKARLSEEIEVSDADIDLELQERPPRLLPRRWRLRNLFLRFGSDDPSAVHARLQAIRRRVSDGASFEALAREHSQSETRWRGGLLGNVRLGTFPQAVDDVIRGLEPGQVSDVLESSDGVTLLYCEEILEAVTRTPEELREFASGRVYRKRYDRALGALREALKQKAQMAILDGPDGPSVRFTGGLLEPETSSFVVGRRPEQEWPETWPQAWQEALGRFVVGRMALLHEAEQGLGPDAGARSGLLWEERRILAAALLALQVEARFDEPTEADLRRAFETAPETYRLAPSYDLQVVRLPRFRPAKSNAAEDRGSAPEILARLRSGELTFDDAARIYSIHGSATRGGRIDSLAVSRVAPRLGLEVARAVRELSIGEISELVWTEDSIWILRLLEQQPERSATFAEARSDVHRRWIRDALDRIRDDLVARRLEALDIR